MSGESQSPAIGIDLGTTYSCVAVWRDDRVEIIPNDQGNRITPSCVSFREHERLAGDSAMNLAASNPVNTVFDAKRLIGRRFSDPLVRQDIGVLRDEMSVVVPRNTPFPTKMERVFMTEGDNQTSCKLYVYEGERSRSSDNIYLGEFTLRDVPRAPRGVEKIDVCFDIDADGILNVSAAVRTTGKRVSHKIGNAVPKKDEVDKMIEDAERFKSEDERHRSRFAERTSLKNYIYSTMNSVSTTGKRGASSSELPAARDAKRIRDEINSSIVWLNAEAVVLERKRKELESSWDPLIRKITSNGTY